MTVQVPVPEQAPDQPVNLESKAGVAVKVTTVPDPKELIQVSPQLIPAGELVTVPEPVPSLLTQSIYWAVLKVAVADLLEVIVIVQVPVPEQAPDQPANSEPESGVAVKVTVVP